MTDFRWPVRVYWEDTDAGGVVYHAQYVAFLERARSEWLRHHGWSQVVLKRDFNVQFVVAKMTLSFHKPAVYDDELQVTAGILVRKGASMVFRQSIWRAEELLVSAEVVVACVDAVSFKPKRLPAPMDLQ